MRALGRPEVVKSALLAGSVTALACLPRLAYAAALKYPAWYLEMLLFLGSIVLWAFVFAWHTEYSHRPVFTLRIGWGHFALATGLGIVTALLVSLGDPALQARTPADYPRDLWDWGAMTLFSLAFTQLFLIFAPFAWLLRLFRSISAAVVLTVLFGLFVLAAKNRGPAPPMPLGMLLGLVLYRLTAGLLCVYFFLRGGVLLVSWWTLLVQSRHLWQLDW